MYGVSREYTRRLGIHTLGFQKSSYSPCAQKILLTRNNIYIYIYIYILCMYAIGLVGRVFGNGPDDRGLIQVVLKIGTWYCLI